MRGWRITGRSLFFLSMFAVGSLIATPPASASSNRNHPSLTRASYHYAAYGRHTPGASAHSRYARHGRRFAYGGISCVPFARNDSGISVAGNAWEWWDNAAGVYARGSVPEAGSVLTFRSNGRMRLGHVAVVSRVINAREVEVDQANWWGPGMYGGVARNIPVVDVSEANDWTAVRVGLGESGQFGSVYPTYGFIYDRPDTGVMVAAHTAPAPQPDLNPAPNDLRPAAERGEDAYDEVAEAPIVPKRLRRGTHVVSGSGHTSSRHSSSGSHASSSHGRAHQVAALEQRR
jgi:surface antigen